jgi:hypothetical protein
LSTNIGRIAESFQLTLGRLRQVEEQWKTAEGKLLSLAQERDELTGRLKVAMESGKETEELRRLLRQKEAEIAEKGEQAENLRANIRAIYREGFRCSSSSVTSTETLSAETTSVVTRHFLPPSCTVSPDDKLQLNVAADHHRVSNTPFVVGRVAQFGFVREVGLGHRHNTKQGKVRPQRDVTRLELLVPYDGEADIVRVITTATCKEQQLLAAHLIGQAFEVEIQQPT